MFSGSIVEDIGMVLFKLSSVVLSGEDEFIRLSVVLSGPAVVFKELSETFTGTEPVLIEGVVPNPSVVEFSFTPVVFHVSVAFE